MMHCFVTPWTAVVTFSARPAAAGLRCAPPLLLARRPQGRSRNFSTSRPQRELLRSPGGVPEIARVFPEQYESLLNEKVELLQSLLADAVTHHDEDEALPPIEVFRSPSLNFRMRASFQVWRDGVDPDATRHFVMYNRDDKVMPREVLTYPMGSLRINALMAPTLEAISRSEVLQRKVRQRGQSSPLAGPQLVSCASSGRAWWLWAACTPRRRERPAGRPATASGARANLELAWWELAASKVATKSPTPSTAFGPPGERRELPDDALGRGARLYLVQQAHRRRVARGGVTWLGLGLG